MQDNIIDKLTLELNQIEKDFSAVEDKSDIPSLADVISILNLTEHLLFPRIFPHSSSGNITIKECLKKLENMLINILRDENTAGEILISLPDIKRVLITDAIAIYEGDPAASSLCEVMLAYPGFFAIMIYRIANIFYAKKIPYIPRIMTEHAHERTGIDIHPGATIGEGFCIDHGTGVVIGETARIGKRVKIYQGVTIGAKSFEADTDGRIVKGKKRHPDIEDGCIIYAGATILGGDTVIGKGSIIGGNVWLTHSLPPGSRVYYKEK